MTPGWKNRDSCNKKAPFKKGLFYFEAYRY